MSGDYTPKGFLRNVPDEYLKEYFGRREVLQELQWGDLKKGRVDAIFDAWQLLPAPQLEEIESEFRMVHDLATLDGVRAVVEEGEFHNKDLGTALEAIEGHHAKAMWVHLNHPDIFRVSALMDRADHLNGRYWHRRKGLPKKKPSVSAEAKDQLASALSSYFWKKEGRGRKHCVETYLRGGRRHYFFAYLDDYAGTFVGYGSGNELVRRPQQPAFETVFVYDEVDGTLDLYARGKRERKEDLQQIFGRTILQEEIGPETRRNAPFDLALLKNRDFSFQLRPTDGVRSLRLKSLRLYLLSNRAIRMTFEGYLSDSPQTTVDVHEVIERTLAQERVPLAAVGVDHATIEAKFVPKEGWREKITFAISENSCSLKDRPEEIATMECLKRCKVARV